MLSFKARSSDRVRFQLEHINQFLEVLYGSQHRITQALRAHGVSDIQLYQLRDQALDWYLVELFRRWKKWLSESISARSADVIIRRYGLNGDPKVTLAEIAQDYKVSRERIRQVEQTTLRRLREPANLEQLEQIAAALIQEIPSQL